MAGCQDPTPSPSSARHVRELFGASPASARGSCRAGSSSSSPAPGPGWTRCSAPGWPSGPASPATSRSRASAGGGRRPPRRALRRRPDPAAQSRRATCRPGSSGCRCWTAGTTSLGVLERRRPVRRGRGRRRRRGRRRLPGSVSWPLELSPGPTATPRAGAAALVQPAQLAHGRRRAPRPGGRAGAGRRHLHLRRRAGRRHRARVRAGVRRRRRGRRRHLAWPRARRYGWTFGRGRPTARSSARRPTPSGVDPRDVVATCASCRARRALRAGSATPCTAYRRRRATRGRPPPGAR